MRSSRIAGRLLLAFLVASIAVALLGGLVGCSSAPSSGTVTSKHYTAPYSWVNMVCISYGKYGCQAYMPVTEDEPASWSVTLTNGDQSGDVDVDQHTWQQLRVGDHYP